MASSSLRLLQPRSPAAAAAAAARTAPQVRPFGFRPCSVFLPPLPSSASSHNRRPLLICAVAAPPAAPPCPAPPDSSPSFFDPSSPPPFSLSDIRAAIPKHCWIKNPWISFSYLARDVALVFSLAALAAFFNNWLLWPLYWFAQGTMFWALFVLGHDCGHGSFSNDKKLNDLVGHLAHSSILVPYHGWRISHRTHHQHHGHVENDESWHPLSEKLYRSLDGLTRMARFSPLALFAYPFYLVGFRLFRLEMSSLDVAIHSSFSLLRLVLTAIQWGRSPGKTGSHYFPSSSLFVPSEKHDVLTSTACWAAMLALLVGLTFAIGPLWMLKLYVVPYWINVVWLDVVTYLHHHGYEQKVPWYRGQEWNYMRGGLSTIDRDYGWFNNIHHDIGTHVVHHLFPQIPHYHLVEATEAVKPVLGKYYREPEESKPFPSHLWKHLVKSFSEDHFVDDDGEVVFYKTDTQ